MLQSFLKILSLVKRCVTGWSKDGETEERDHFTDHCTLHLKVNFRVFKKINLFFFSYVFVRKKLKGSQIQNLVSKLGLINQSIDFSMYL